MANINAQFNYSANFGPVIGQMQKLTAEANILNNTLQNLDKQSVGLKQNIAGAFASDLGKIGGWNAKMVELTDSVDQFGQSLLKQKLTLKQYAQEAIGAFTKSSNAHKLAVREVSREMSQLVTLGKGMDGKQMGMMITPATINLKDFNTQLAVSQKQWSIFNSLVQDGTTHLINFGKNTQWAGRQITVGLTVPLTIYGNTVSKIFREVDAELTRFQKVYGSDLMNSTSDATDQMVNDVRNLAIEFSKSFGIAAKETASLAADLAATGLEGQKLLASLRETTRLAVLGDVSNQDAMKTTLSLQNAFKISTDELAESVNFLNAVENQTSLSLQDLTTAIPKAGPVIKSLGGDVKDLSLLMVALKEGGISAAEGANALKSGMASLINPTKQASATAKQYGIDINAIVQANRGQLMPTIMAFQQQLELLDDFGKAQVIENVFGKYQFARLSALFDNLNASASQTNAVLGLMGKSSKELAATAYQEMDTLMNSSSKRFQRAIEAIKAQFISIGQSITESITPILENVTGKIQKAIEFFQNLPKPVKSFIKVATGLTAIAGPIIMMVGIFSNFLGYIGKGAMGMVNLGRRMAGIPVQKFEMLTDTQIMAQKATEQLSASFDRERSSVERLNQALGLYKQNLVDAISLNPAFVNRQMPSAAPTTPQLRMGGRMPGYANNSSAWVPGSGDGDKVPAMLEPGEYVVNKKAAAKYSGTLDQINYQSAPRFQKGGRMPGYADTSMLPYESIREVKKAEPFIGPLPQISYGVQGTYRPGGYTPFMEYPFSSRESAEAFQATDPRRYGGRTSRITRDINDPQQQAYADWIAGHNSNQFRTGTGVMKRLDMEGHRDQMLRSMGPISQNIPLYRGTVLKEKGANEFSGVGARELLMYIKHGMFEKAMGKKIQWSDMQSFSSIPNIASYSKFIESWTNPSNTNSKKAADRQLASMEMLPVIFRLASAKGQNGFNLSERALVQEVGMGDVVDEKEWVLNSPSGNITGIRQDMGTKNYIVDLMQNGGRVQSAAEGLTEEQKQQALFDYTDMSAQNRQFEGFGRGAFRTVRNNDALYRTNPLQNAFHVLLPNAVGRSEEEKTQLNILRRYMSMFNITDPNQLDAGMQASLMEMFMVHGGGESIGVDPSLIKPMGEYDTGSAQLEGPGTYFSSNLKIQDEIWDDYGGSHKFTISKTREAFRKVARGKGYIEAYDEDTGFHEPSKQLKALVNSFSRTNSGKEATETRRFVKNHWLRDAQSAAENSGPGSPFYKYLIEKEYQGIQWGPSVITNFNIGRKGISLSSISNPFVDSVYDNDIEEYVDLKKPLQATIPNLSPVGYQSGGRIKGYADESLKDPYYYGSDESLRYIIDEVLPNATGSTEQEFKQIEILRNAVENFKQQGIFAVSDDIYGSLPQGIRGALYDMFAIHRSRNPELKATTMPNIKSAKGLMMQGPGTYLSPTLRDSQQWQDYSGNELYRIKKTQSTFMRDLKGKGYLPDESLPSVIKEWNSISSEKDRISPKDTSDFGFYAPGGDAYEYLNNLPPTHPFFDWAKGQGYLGVNAYSGNELINWKIGDRGTSFSKLDPNRAGNYGYQSGGRIKGYADESLMPEKYSKKMENIQSIMDATSQEASGGMYAGMPMTDIGSLVDRIGGRSAAIPGASGIYEQGGVRSVVKGHSTATSARIEAIASALTRSIFGLESPVQEFIKFGHPETSSPMFGVRSPFDEKFAKTTGKISPDKFFMQALSAIIRGDSDLQPDNLYDGIVVDQGAGYGSDRASQPRGLTGKKFSVGDQAKVNFLMQKGGARRWFTEATAGIASGMTREQYIGGFMQAISQAQANFPAAMASLAGMNLTKEEQQIFGVLAGDLEGARGIDWGSIYDSHIGVTPEVKKPVTEAAAAKALLTKQANKEDYEKAIAAGYPSWMGYAQGGRINGYATKSMSQGPEKDLYEKEYQSNKLAFAHSVPYMKFGASRLLYPIGFDIPRTMNANLSKTSVREIELNDHINRPKALTTMTSLFNKIGTNVNPKTIQSFVSNRLNKTNPQDTINDPELYQKALQSKTVQSLMEDFKKQGEFSDVRTNLKEFGVDKAFDALGYTLEEDGSYTLTNAPEKLKGFPLPEKIYQRNKPDYTVFQTSPSGVGGTLAKTRDNTEYRRADSPGTVVYPNVIEVALAKLFGATDELTGKKVTGISHLLDPKNLQSGGRINGYATETTTWAKKAAAPKAYAGVLQNIPNWATKPAEYQAIVEALRAAGVPDSDRLASFYIQDVLAHINPSTTNANGIYEKVWAAANLMKDSQVYNVFLETLRTRKDIGGLLNPSTVSRVAGASGLSASIVQAELTKIADGVHPNTANGAKVMMTLARMFPSRTAPGMPIAVAAGMGARLQGNFYDTLGQRALPSNLPNTTVRAYDPKGTGAPTSTTQGSRTASSGIVMPSGAIRPSMVMPNIQSIQSAAGGTGTSATVKVDGMGNVLSNGIDDMVAKTVTGQPIAVSSKELLAIGPGGGIAGVTSPGDEARGKIVHPMGTSLMRGGKFQRLRGFATTSVTSGLDFVEGASAQASQQAQQETQPVYQEGIASGRMDQFAGRMMMMVGVVDQMRFAMNQFTSETSNGTSKWVASMNLALTGTQLLGQNTGGMLIAKGKEKQGLQVQLDPETNQPLMDEKGNPIYGKTPGVKPSKMSSGIGKAMAGLGKAANFLGNPAMQIGLQVAIMAVNKGIEMYQKAMENAKKAGNAAFGEPTESAKLLGIELKSLTAGSEKLGKSAEKIFGVQGKGSYDKAFEKVVKTDYQDLITVINKAKTEQEQLNQLTNVYSNLIQRGFDPKNAKELTAEIARQAEAMGAFTKVSGSLDNIKDSKDAVKAQLETFQSQMTILKDRKDLATSVGGKDVLSGVLGVASMVPGMNIASRGIAAAVGSGPLKTQSSDLRADAVNEFFGVQGDEFWKKALRGTGLDRNPIAQALGGYLADKTMKTQMAAQLGATIKSIFSIAADNPTASNEALRMLVAQFDSIDWDKAKEELAKIAEEKGFGDLSQIGQFVQSDTFKNLGEREQTIALSVINAGGGAQLEKMLTESWESVDWEKLGGIAAQNLALNAIDVEVDLQLKDSIAQMELLKSAIQQSFTVAIEAKQKELEIEDKRHEKAIKNLDDEAKRIADKKDILQRNTDYYIKELEREKQAEDYYANQRKTGLSGLKAISGGDVFGFIGAQMDAASSADQFGRDRSMQAIQETADAGQKKLDEDLRAIDNRKEAEAARHEQEVANINAEIEFLQKKQSATVGGIDKATKLLEKAMAMSPGDKGYQQAVTDAVQAAEAAGGSGQQVMQQLNISSPDKDIQGRIDSASKSLGDALKIITGDTTDAVDRLNAASEIAKNVFESLDIDPATSQAYTDLFKTLQTPLDPTVSEAIQAFKYPTANNYDQGTLDGPPITEQDGSKTKVYKKNTVAVRGKTPYSPVTKATGGMIEGPGTGTSDSILAMVSNGEYVVRAEAVKNIGKAKLDQLNRAGLNGFAMGGLVGSMPAMSSAPGFASGGSIPMPTVSAPSSPKYNIPSAGGGMSPSPIAKMARGGQINSSSSSVNSSPVMNFNGAGMDMVMHHVNKAVGGRISSNSRRIG